MLTKTYEVSDSLPPVAAEVKPHRVIGRAAAAVDALLVAAAFFAAFAVRQNLMSGLAPLSWGADQKLGLIGLDG